MSVCGFVYSTVSNLKEAESIAQILVQKRLVACVNIIPQVVSYYENQGQIERHKEVSLILKTQENLFLEVQEEIKKIHPYDCPCIVFVPFEKGNPDFLNWIQKNLLNK